MTYTPTTWTDDTGEPIDAENLNKIEQGIADIDASVTTLNSEVSTLLTVSDEGSVYVSTKGWADDGNNGLTPSTPLASIAAARDLIGDDVGRRIILGSGDHAATPDGDLVLSAEGQGIIAPMGPGATRILMSGDGTWGVKAQHSFCTISGFMLETSGEVQYGVGVSTPTDTGTASGGEIERVWVVPAAAMDAAFTLGPDHPGSSTVDIATTAFRHCTAFPNTDGAPATGILDRGFLFGNHTSGNVAANEAFGCTAIAARIGVDLDGSGIVWFGGGFGYITEADIEVLHAAGTPIEFYGMRSELGAMALKSGYVGRGFAAVLLSGCEFDAYTPDDGETIISHAAGSLILLGGSYRVQGGNAQIAVDPFSGGGLVLEAHGVSFDSADPYRGVPAAVTRITSGTMFDDSGNPTSNPGADAAGGWTDYTPTIGGTGWALGNATVIARWKSVSGVANVAVTISWGSTSTFGTGALEVGLPADALASPDVPNATVVRAVFEDAGNNLFNLNGNIDPGGLAKVTLYSQDAAGAWGGGHTATNPATVSTGDTLNLTATYEAA